MKKVPKREPVTVATRVHISPAPMLSAVTPVAMAVRLMLLTNHRAPRWRGVPWRSSSGIQSTEWTSTPDSAGTGAGGAGEVVREGAFMGAPPDGGRTCCPSERQSGR